MRRSTYILILILFAAMACLLAAAAHAVANPPRWAQPSRVYVPPLSGRSVTRCSKRPGRRRELPRSSRSISHF